MSRRPRPTGPFALALAGVGPRRWRPLDALQGPEGPLADEGAVLCLPAAEVIERWTLRLNGLPGDAEQAAGLLARIEAAGRRGLAVAGYLGYELGLALENLALPPRAQPDLPDAELLCFDPTALTTFRPARGVPGALREPPSMPPDLPAVLRAHRAVPASLLRQRTDWLNATRAALEGIGRGGLYQVNLSAQFPVALPGGLSGLDLVGLVRAVQRVQAVPYALAMQTSGGVLVSGSMERAATVLGAQIHSRPIKGTRARGAERHADAVARAALLADPKERAENTMIVDMVRNDLSRVCLPGTVRVPALCEAVPYRTLWHLESEIAGTLEPGCRPPAWLAAILPPASVTGCPKVAAMRFIAAAEGRRRGPYCGALGVALPDGDADWSVGIRQVVIQGRRAWLSVGSGIVADSVPEREWEETCLKAASGLRLVAALGAAGRGIAGQVRPATEAPLAAVRGGP